MKKVSFFVAIALTVAWSATSLTLPATAQYDSSTLAQMGAMSTMNAHIKAQAKDPGYWNRRSRNRRSRTVRNTRRYRQSRLSASGRRTRSSHRASYRSRR